MSARRYYSSRTGTNPQSISLDLAMLRQMFRDCYVELREDGYFQEAFGYSCIDEQIPNVGTLGFNIEARLLRALRKTNLWPVEEHCLKYSEDDLFDIIEFLFDHVSEGTKGYYHDYGYCDYLADKIC